MATSLAGAFAAASPRIQRPPTPRISLLIHGAVLGLWALLLLGTLGQGGLLAWSVGIAYVLYDTGLLVFTFLTLRQGLAQPAPVAASPGVARSTSPGIDVLVAAHNEAGVLPVTLGALLAQCGSADRILLVDDGSSDGTAVLLATRFGLTVPDMGQLSLPSRTDPRLHWLRLPHGGKARALNAALPHTEREVLLTLDADTLLAPGALVALRDAFAAQPRLVAATGVLQPLCGTGPSARVLEWFQTYEYIRNFLSRRAWMAVDGLLLISGACAGFRRSAVIAVGGFDDDCLVEDYELIHRLRRHGAREGLGWTTQVLGQVRATTEAPGSLGAFVRQRRRWFGGFLQTQYWYRDMVGVGRYGRVGTRMLPVKAIDTLQPLFGLTALVLLIGHLLRGDLPFLLPVSGVIGAKIGIDLLFHLWSVRAYRRWVGSAQGTHLGYALLAALAEPFSFQILRHTSAAMGWWLFLRGRMEWGRQSRHALTEPRLQQLPDFTPPAVASRPQAGAPPLP